MTLKLGGGVKLPSELIVPMATVIPLRESTTVIAAPGPGHVKLCPAKCVQLPVAPGSKEMHPGELLSEQFSDPVSPDTVTERNEIV